MKRGFEKFKALICFRKEERYAGIPTYKLPSTSPANAAWSLERLCETWRKEVIGG